MKKLHFLSQLMVIMLLLLQSVGLPYSVAASEVQVTATNQQTGADSTNTAEARVSRRVEIINRNHAAVQSNIDQQASTGFNTVSQVNGDVEVTTGDIQQGAAIENDLNHNQTQVEGATGGTVEAGNYQTGSASTNATQSEASETIEVTHENDAKITNTQIATLNTGFNTAKEVNGDTKVETGKIEFETKVENEEVNTNDVKIHSSDEDLVVKTTNKQTQSDSINLAKAKVTNDVIEHDQNKLTAENNTDTVANTGGNTCEEINGGCTLRTGDIRGRVEVDNEGNDNDKKIGPTPTPTVPLPTVPTPPPTLTPTPEIPEPSPTSTEKPEAPQGGPGPMEPSPTPTQEPESTPTPTEEKPDGITDDQEEKSEEKPLQEKVKEAVKKLVPKVQAAEEEEKEEKPQILGITTLPVTGIGYNGMGMPLGDIILGLSLITGGLFIRRGTDKPKDCEAPLR